MEKSIMLFRKIRRFYLIITFFCILPYAFAEPVRFHAIDNNLDDFFKVAAKDGKLIFIDMYTDWCGPCKRMDSEVFIQDEVGARMNNEFINLKINAEKGIGREIAKKYNVISYPTYLFLDSDGVLVYKALGYMSKDKLFVELANSDRVWKSSRSISELEKQYQLNRNNANTLFNYLGKRTELQLDNAELIDEYISLLDDTQKSEIHNLQLIADNGSFDSRSLYVGDALDFLLSNQDKFHSLKNVEDVEIYISMAQERSLGKAIKERDEVLLDRILDYNKFLNLNIYDDEYADRIKLKFYYGIKDLEKYNKTATVYVDDKLLKLGEDSLMKLDFQVYESVKESMKGQLQGESEVKKRNLLSSYRFTQTIQVARLINEICNESISLSKQQQDLNRLETWMRYSLKLMDRDIYYFRKIRPYSIDLLSKIVYYQGKKEEGLSLKREAINLLRSNNNEEDSEEILNLEKEYREMI